MRDTVTLIPLRGLPLAQPGDDLAELLAPAVAAARAAAADVLVVAQKIVSKAENRYVHLAAITPTAKAMESARVCEKDPRLVELILRQSERVLRCVKGVLITRHKLGFTHANAGIDHSNIPQDKLQERVLLLPERPDRSAAALRAGLQRRLGVSLGVIINDSVGRAWRLGSVGIAIGAAGVACLRSDTGRADLLGNELRATEIGLADEIAAAASLVMGQADEAVPAVLVKGLKGATTPDVSRARQTAAALIRAEADDLFS